MPLRETPRKSVLGYESPGTLTEWCDQDVGLSKVALRYVTLLSTYVIMMFSWKMEIPIPKLPVVLVGFYFVQFVCGVIPFL